MTQIRRIAVQCDLGECPVWDAKRSCLFVTDITGCRLIALSLPSGDRREWPIPSLGGGTVLMEDGRLLVLTQTGPFCFDPDSEVWSSHGSLPVDPDHRPNEAKAGPDGALWFGVMSTMGRHPSGGLFRADPETGGITRMLDTIAVPNCLVWRPDGGAYFTDSARGTIWSFAQASTIGQEDPDDFARPAPAGVLPDGGALDAEGCLWVALFGGGGLVRLDPDGRVIADLALPVPQVTSIAFVGPALDRLAVTTAKRLLTPEERLERPHSGDVFILDPGVRGTPVQPLRLSPPLNVA